MAPKKKTDVIPTADHEQAHKDIEQLTRSAPLPTFDNFSMIMEAKRRARQLRDIRAKEELTKELQRANDLKEKDHAAKARKQPENNDDEIREAIEDIYSCCFHGRTIERKTNQIFPFVKLLADRRMIFSTGDENAPFRISDIKTKYKIYEVWKFYLKGQGITLDNVFTILNDNDPKSIVGNYASERARLNDGKDFLTQEEKSFFKSRLRKL